MTLSDLKCDTSPYIFFLSPELTAKRKFLLHFDCLACTLALQAFAIDFLQVVACFFPHNFMLFLSENEGLFYHRLFDPTDSAPQQTSMQWKRVFPLCKTFSCWFCINFHSFYCLSLIEYNWKKTENIKINSSIYMEFPPDQKRFRKRFQVYFIPRTPC